MTWLSVTALAK